MVSFMGIDMEVNVITASLKVSFIYCIYCFVLHYAVIKLSPVFIRDFKNMNKKNQKVWFNKAVSIIHAITMFLLTMHYWIFMNPTLTLPVFVGEREALCLDIMMGYLWYDSIYEISTGGQIDTLGHHILGLISHMSSRFSNSGALGFYSMLVYIAEGSTPYLHLSWLFHTLKLKDTIFFKILVLVLLLSFFVCRILLSPFMLWHMFTYQDMWVAGRLFLFWANWAIVFCFGALNYFWFYKLIAVAMKV